MFSESGNQESKGLSGYALGIREDAERKKAIDSFKQKTQLFTKEQLNDATRAIDQKIADDKRFEAAQIGDTITSHLEGKEISVVKVDPVAEYNRLKSNGEVKIKKTAIVRARQVTNDAGEEVVTTQENQKAHAKKNDWIITNPGDNSSYVFGDRNLSGDQNTAVFLDTYDKMPGQEQVPVQENKWRKKSTKLVDAVLTDRAIIFHPSWGGKGENKTAEPGSYLAKGEYSIDKDSFASGDYELVVDEPIATTEAATI